jgi:hypothetical protein
VASATILAGALGQCGFARGSRGGALLMRCSPSRQALCSVGERSLRATSCCVMATVTTLSSYVYARTMPIYVMRHLLGRR